MGLLFQVAQGPKRAPKPPAFSGAHDEIRSQSKPPPRFRGSNHFLSPFPADLVSLCPSRRCSIVLVILSLRPQLSSSLLPTEVLTRRRQLLALTKHGLEQQFHTTFADIPADDTCVPKYRAPHLPRLLRSDSPLLCVYWGQLWCNLS